MSSDPGRPRDGPPPLPEWVAPWLVASPWPTAVVAAADGTLVAANARFHLAAGSAGLTADALARDLALRAELAPAGDPPPAGDPTWLVLAAGLGACAAWPLPSPAGAAPGDAPPWLALELRDEAAAPVAALHREIAQRALLHALREQEFADRARHAQAAAERREAELGAVIESIPDAVYLGTALGPLRANGAARALLGPSLSDDPRVHGPQLRAAIHAAARRAPSELAVPPAPGDGWEALFARALLGERVAGEVRLAWGGDGPPAPRVVHCAAAPVRIDGQVVAAVAVLTDLTAARALDARLQEEQQLARIGRLAGGVAHEFNNLLTIIDGHADAVEHALAGAPATASTDPARADLATIRSAVTRAAALTRQLLAYGRQQVRHPAVLDVATLVREAARAIARVLPPAIAVRVDVAPDVGPVEADRAQLEQVLLNLALNARDAMPTGGTITLHAAPVPAPPPDVAPAPPAAPHGWIALAVRDTGVGMSDAVRAHLFEPFFTTKPIGQGTGLGLAMVQGIVAQSGGAVGVTSAPGAGTTVTLYLPATHADAPAGAAASDPPPVETRRPSDPPAPGFGGGRRLLVVDDEPAVRRLMARALAADGWTVLEAGSGEEALALAGPALPTGAAAGPPLAVLVSDVAMPGMRGPELADRLRRARPGLRVLLVSGHAAPALRPGASGADDPAGAPDTGVLQKPFTPAELRARVRALLGAAGGQARG